MRVAIIGAGPAGLYAGILLKRARPDIDLTVLEQNPPDATFGFGVVFSDQALAFLREDDPETADLIEPAMLRWTDITVLHRGEAIAIDGVGFAAIGRLELLGLLQRRAAELGVVPRYNTRLADLSTLDGFDLVIAADGVNSLIRNATPEAFGQSLRYGANRFVWYGADREFSTLTQSFIDTPHGRMNAHHYSYAKGRSTFIIEMTAEVFARSGFAAMAEADYRRECEACFADVLDGAHLIANHSVWRRFPDLSCDTWHHRNRVLVGDALHTAHFSIGSGTRLALEDVIALVDALKATDWRVGDALPRYQAERKPGLDRLQGAARRSLDWYEAYDRHMDIDPWPFALNYLGRAGRLTAGKIAKISPRFAEGLAARGIALEVA